MRLLRSLNPRGVTGVSWRRAVTAVVSEEPAAPDPDHETMLDALRAGLGADAVVDHAAHPLVIGAVAEDELDLVALGDVREVAPAVAVRLTGSGCLEVHDLVHAWIDV